MTEAQKPLPCPFCGGAKTMAIPRLNSEFGFPEYWVTCLGCDARGPAGETDDDAIAAWNKRADTADKRRFEWFFSSVAPVGYRADLFRALCKQGFKEEWNADQWRSAIDRAITDTAQGEKA